MAGMLDTLTVDRERMREAAGEGFTTATSVADTLVRQGVPFRAAHHVVGVLVARAEADGIGLDQLDDTAIRAAVAASDDTVARGLADDPEIGATLRAAADIDAALASCDVIGGTAPGRVRAALAEARTRLDREG
jgi:argininosuccinate lyase